MYDKKESNNGYYPVIVEDLDGQFSDPDAFVDKVNQIY